MCLCCTSCGVLHARKEPDIGEQGLCASRELMSLPERCGCTRSQKVLYTIHSRITTDLFAIFQDFSAWAHNWTYGYHRFHIRMYAVGALERLRPSKTISFCAAQHKKVFLGRWSCPKPNRNEANCSFTIGL